MTKIGSLGAMPTMCFSMGFGAGGIGTALAGTQISLNCMIGNDGISCSTTFGSGFGGKRGIGGSGGASSRVPGGSSGVGGGTGMSGEQIQSNPDALKTAGLDGVGGGTGMSVKQIQSNPGALKTAGLDGVEIKDLDLQKGSDGNLTESSKTLVNKTISDLSGRTGAEVAANVYEKGDGTLGTRLFSTGDRYSVSFNPAKNTIYNAHTHIYDSDVPPSEYGPSKTDLENEIKGALDVVVPCDDIVGNETGEYIPFG